MNVASLTPAAMPQFGDPSLQAYRFTYCYQVPTRSKSPNVHSDTNGHSTAMNSNSERNTTMEHERTSASAPAAGLLQLPIEIRHMIYHQLGFSTNHRRKVQTSRYSADEVSVRASYFFQSGDGSHNQRGVQRPLNPLVRGKGIVTPVMRICKQVANETYELLYGDTNVGIGWDMATERGWYVGKNSTIHLPESPMRALPFAPEPFPTFLGTRSLSYLTHITLGPLSHPDYADPLDIYIRMLNYIALRCRKLQFLGIHLSDKCQIPSEGIQRLGPFIDAISNIMRCCQLKKLWMGSARSAHENLDIEVARRLASKSKNAQMDEILATARRRQIEARRNLLACDDMLTKRTTDFEISRDKLGKVIDGDYRIRSRKAEVLSKMDDLLRSWRRDMDASVLSWIPQTAVVAMNLQLSGYNQLVGAQEFLATRILALQQIDCLVKFIQRQKEQHSEKDEPDQEALEMKLRAILDFTSEYSHSMLSYLSFASPNAQSSRRRVHRRRIVPEMTNEEIYSCSRSSLISLLAEANALEAKSAEPAAQVHQRITRMTELLPESLSELPPDFDPILAETLPSPISLPALSSDDPENQVEQSSRRQKFDTLRASIVTAAKAAQDADTHIQTDNMTAAEARRILAEHIGKLMSNMGFKTAPASPQRVSSSSALASKGSTAGAASVEGMR